MDQGWGGGHRCCRLIFVRFQILKIAKTERVRMVNMSPGAPTELHGREDLHPPTSKSPRFPHSTFARFGVVGVTTMHESVFMEHTTCFQHSFRVPRSLLRAPPLAPSARPECSAPDMTGLVDLLFIVPGALPETTRQPGGDGERRAEQMHTMFRGAGGDSPCVENGLVGNINIQQTAI